MQRHFGISMATAAILSAVSSMSFADNAISLDDDQLDTVNAGAVAITANANATAFGPITKTITLTNTYTTSFVSPKGRYVELGVGVAVAEACCGPSVATGVDMGAAATGYRTLATTTTSSLSTPFYSRSVGYAGAVAYGR